MPVQAPLIRQAALRGNEEKRLPLRQMPRDSEEEAQGGRHIALRLGGDLVQRPGREATVRQMGVESWKPEGKDLFLGRNPVPSWQKLAQRPDDIRALAAWLPGHVERRLHTQRPFRSTF